MCDLDWNSPLAGGNQTNEYAEMLQDDPEWQEVRKLVIERDKGCVMCKATSNLRVHHVSYEDFYNPEFLVTLCNKCHEQVHEITKAYKEFTQGNGYHDAIAYVNDEIASKCIDPFVIERCAELSPNGDLHFFTGPLNKRTNINDFIHKLISLDPYKTGLQEGESGWWIRPNGSSSFTRYQKMRLEKKEK